jgi:carbamoyl-phosphate synthase large subunit
MATVLVTGVGGVGGFATVQTINEHTTHEVVGVDMDPSALGLHKLDKSRVVPPASSETWIPEMEYTISEFDIDAVVPLVDEELDRLSELKEEVSDNVAFVCPTQEVIDLALDKYRMAEVFERERLPVPETKLGYEEPPSFPVVVKPRRGHGSEGIELLESQNDVEQYFESTEYSPEEVVLQRYVDGPEYTTSVVATKDNDLLGIVPKQVIEKEGNTVKGVTQSEDAVICACLRIYDVLEPCGPINVQQIHDEETNTIYTIEVNPRFSSSACLTVEAGVNELDLLIRNFLGEPISEPDGFEDNVYMVRYTDQAFLHDDEMHANLESD